MAPVEQARSQLSIVEQAGELIDSLQSAEDFTPRQVQKDAARVVGNIYSIAVDESIKPPEAAFYRLSESQRKVVIGLFGAAIKPGYDKGKRRMPPETAARIGRVLSYINERELDTT